MAFVSHSTNGWPIVYDRDIETAEPENVGELAAHLSRGADEPGVRYLAHPRGVHQGSDSRVEMGGEPLIAGAQVSKFTMR